ncbi:hypothetical protein [Micromonospora sp. KLBMP9576]|uniref:hypothetical protein n=1 Tax=Micromonospora sp. KLBMP9576 TaxID=3424769 RepID=UPI003D94ED88
MATETSTFRGRDFDQLRATDPRIAAGVLGEPDRLGGGRRRGAGGSPTSPAVPAAPGSTVAVPAATR